jgi:hypothetical protein
LTEGTVDSGCTDASRARENKTTFTSIADNGSGNASTERRERDENADEERERKKKKHTRFSSDGESGKVFDFFAVVLHRRSRGNAVVVQQRKRQRNEKDDERTKNYHV